MYMQTRSKGKPTPARTAATPRQASRSRRPIDAMLHAATFKALGNKTRVSLLACAAKCGRACSVSELAACCSVDLSVVSRHLRTLERAGLMQSRRRGQKILYSVRYADVAGLLRRLADELDACAAACPAGCSGKSCGVDTKECGCG